MRIVRISAFVAASLFVFVNAAEADDKEKVMPLIGFDEALRLGVLAGQQNAGVPSTNAREAERAGYAVMPAAPPPPAPAPVPAPMPPAPALQPF